MKIDRLIGILFVLLQKNKVTSRELAEKFEVSRRTIIRDIETINKAGIPIVTYQGQGGGISIMDGFRIDRTLLSLDDMSAILTGLKSLDSVSSTNRYKQIMDKLSAERIALDGSIIIDLSMWDKSAVSDKIELIKTAIQNQNKISFRYFSPDGESIRVIEPYKLVFQWSNWYIWGYCTIREDYRLFKLTRIMNLHFTEDKYQIRQASEYICDKLRHTRGGTETVVKFDKDMKWRIIDEFGTEIPKFDENGNIFITFTWEDIPSLYRYVLTFSDKAEIISPKEYREEFKSILDKIKNKYQI